MKKRMQGFIAGALVASVVVCALPAVAKDAAEQTLSLSFGCSQFKDLRRKWRYFYSCGK